MDDDDNGDLAASLCSCEKYGLPRSEVNGAVESRLQSAALLKGAVQRDVRWFSGERAGRRGSSALT